MKLDTLLGGLNSDQAAVRLDVVRVLGMVDETRALAHLRERYAAEPDQQVREAIAWAGKRLYQADLATYSTVDELFRYFRIDAELETMSDSTEDELMRQMQDRFDSDMRDMQQRATRRKIGTALAAGLAGSAAGLGPLGMALDAMRPGADVAGANLGGPDLAVKRTPATAPSNADIDVWLKRLQGAPKPEQREQAIIELQQLNNPRALPFLAVAFLTDESPKVQQAAQRYGKILYWSMVYWGMEQDGSLLEEMQRRAAALGKTLKVPRKDAPQPDAPQVSTGVEPALPASAQSKPTAGSGTQADIAEILRKAEEARRKRKRDEL